MGKGGKTGASEMMKNARNRRAIKHRTLSRHRAQGDQALGLHPHIAHRQLVGPPPTGNPAGPSRARPRITDAPGQSPFLSSLSQQSRQAGAISLSQSLGAGKRRVSRPVRSAQGPGPGFSDRKRWVFPRSAGLRGGRGVVLRGRWGPPRDPQVWPRPAGSEAASRGLRS